MNHIWSHQWGLGLKKNKDNQGKFGTYRYTYTYTFPHLKTWTPGTRLTHKTGKENRGAATSTSGGANNGKNNNNDSGGGGAVKKKKKSGARGRSLSGKRFPDLEDMYDYFQMSSFP